MQSPAHLANKDAMRRRKLQMKIGLERTSVLQNKEPPPIVDNQYVLMELFQNKAELLKVGIFFTFNVLPCEFLLIKKLEIEKTKTT